jgi:septin family protein
LFSSKPEGYVGFGSLPDQVYRKAVRKGFEFNLMVVGESGLGKVWGPASFNHFL